VSRVDGEKYKLSPLVLIFQTNNDARVMLFNSAKVKKSSTASYFDYIFGNHDICYDFNRFVDVDKLIKLFKEIKKGQVSTGVSESALKNNKKHQMQALHVPYIENKISKLTDSDQVLEKAGYLETY